MNSMRKRAAAREAAKLKRWRASLLHSRAVALGTVEAPDERTAEVVAVERFGLIVEQRKRLEVREE
jgi:hypothetical protein